MISEITAGVLLVMALFFFYISVRSWKNVQEKVFIYLSFVFFAFVITAAVFILGEILYIIIPEWIYFIIDIAVLLILYIIIITR